MFYLFFKNGCNKFNSQVLPIQVGIYKYLANICYPVIDTVVYYKTILYEEFARHQAIMQPGIFKFIKVVNRSSINHSEYTNM